MVNYILNHASSSAGQQQQQQQPAEAASIAADASACSLEKAILSKLTAACQNDSQSTDGDTETTDSIDLAASGSTGAASSNLNEEIESWRKWQEGNKKKLFQAPDQQAVIFRKQQEEMIKKYLSSSSSASSSSTSSASSLSSASCKSSSGSELHLKFNAGNKLGSDSASVAPSGPTKAPSSGVVQQQQQQQQQQLRGQGDQLMSNHHDQSANSSTSEASSPSSTSSYKIEIDNMTNSNAKDEDEEEEELEGELMNSSSVSREDDRSGDDFHEEDVRAARAAVAAANYEDEEEEERRHHDDEDEEDYEDDEDAELDEESHKLIEAYKILTKKFGLDKIKELLLSRKDFNDPQLIASILSGDGLDESRPSQAGVSSPETGPASGHVDTNLIRQQIEHQNNRLSTILEATYEENSPLKKPSARPADTKTTKASQKSLFDAEPPVVAPKPAVSMNKQSKPTKPALVEEPSEERAEEAERPAAPSAVTAAEAPAASQSVLDVDNIQIGVKPTNQMSFEQLIEEKLKIQDQLDREQAKYGSSTRSKVVKKTTLPSKRAASLASAPSATSAAQPATSAASNPTDKARPTPAAKPVLASVPTAATAFNKQQTVNPAAEVNSPSSNIYSIVNSNEQQVATAQPPKQPCKYLKRGEGLKRFMPKSKRSGSANSNSSERTVAAAESQTPVVQEQRLSRQTASGSSVTGSKTTTTTTATSSSASAGAKVLRSNSMSSMTQQAPTKAAVATTAVAAKPQPLKKSQSTASVVAKKAPEPAKPARPPPSSVHSNDHFLAAADGPREDFDKSLETLQYEALEQASQEHPSFLSSASYVESILTNNSHGTLVSSTSRISTGSLISNHSGRADESVGAKTAAAYSTASVQFMSITGLSNRLGGLAEEADDDDDQDDSALEERDELCESRSVVADYDDEYRRGEMQLMRLQSQSTTSTSSAASSSRGVVRKIKRLSGNDDAASSARPQQASSSRNYNCLNYESEEDQLEDAESQSEAAFSERDRVYLRGAGELALQPKTSSRSSSSDKPARPTTTTPAATTTASKFDDSRPWTGDEEEDEEADEFEPRSSYPVSNTSELIQRQMMDLESQIWRQKSGSSIGGGGYFKADESKSESTAESAPVVSQLMTKLFPTIAPVQQQQKNKETLEKLKQKQQQQQPVKPAEAAPESGSIAANALLLKQKLAQLEVEIERYQKKNADLAKLREKAEAEMKSHEAAKKAFDKQKELEMRSLREVHDEEMKKLKQERKLLEQYKQTHKEDRPDRREREEIERLRKQLIELTDEMKTKETRWLANNKRLTERIERLEEEKRELKQELQLMEKKRIESMMTGVGGGHHAERPLSSRLSTSSIPSTSRESSARSNFSIPSTSSILTCSSASSGYSTQPPLTSYPSDAYDDDEHEDTLKEPATTAAAVAKTTSSFKTTTGEPAGAEASSSSLMKLKRCLSEKSLSSSASSTVSSSTSSASVASNGVVVTASHVNPGYSASASASTAASVAAHVVNERLQQGLASVQPLYSKQLTSITNPTVTAAATNSQPNPPPPPPPPSHLASIVQASEALSKYVNSNYFSNPAVNAAGVAASSNATTTTTRKSVSPVRYQSAATKSVKFKLDNSPHEMLSVDSSPPQTINSRASISPRGALRHSNGADLGLGHQTTSAATTNYHHVAPTEPQIRDHFKSSAAALPGEEYLTSLIQPSRRLRVVETLSNENSVEKYFEDGSMRIIYTNGTVKELSKDHQSGVIQFYNGDRKEWDKSKATESYYHARDNIVEHLHPDGTKVLNFSTGQVEKIYPNGTKEVLGVDGTVRIAYPDGSEEKRWPNGNVIRVDANNVKVIEYANGQREVHTSEYKSRQYPNGSVKIVYNDGFVETRYANGQVRIKDSAGNIIRGK